MSSYEEKVTIADSQTVSSDVIDLAGKRLVGIYIPAGFDGTTITFVGSVSARTGLETEEGSDLPTFMEVRDKSGTVVTVTCAASRYVALDPILLTGVHFLKLVAGTSQTGATDLICTLDAAG